MEVVLASASERRQELLKRIVNEFKIIVSDFDETSVNFNGDCEGYVKQLALGKVDSVMNKLNNESIIIGCDTIVYSGNKVLGKPKDKEDAFRMLKSLSGNSHKVYSGIAVMDTASRKTITDCVCTEVFFSELSDEEINKYVDSLEPMDKAGAYGIQGNGGIFVEKICGCYYNVVGLPLNKLYYILRKMGVNL